MINELKFEIKSKLQDSLKKDFSKEVNIVVEKPKKAEMGDLSIPVFVVSKALSKDLPECASYLENELNKIDLVKDVKKMGGFINLDLNKEVISKNVLNEVQTKKDKFGSSNIGNGKNVVIDYSAPNIAKPFSIGHLRSTIIGHSLKKIYEKFGYKVIGVNHLGDWGTQFGKLIIAYKLWSSEEKVNKEPINELFRIYVKFHKEVEEKPELEEQAREAFAELERGNKEYLDIWKKFRDLSIIEFDEMYDYLGVNFDSYNGEAFYVDKTDEVVKELEDLKLLVEDDGAMVVKLGDDVPPALIKKSNGATIYFTRDLAALKYRYDNYQFEKVLYVVGNEQKLHFNSLKEVAKLMKKDYYNEIHHVNFGFVLQDGKKMSTRKGTVVKLYDVLKEASDMALKAIEEKNPDLPNKEQVAKEVGVGAVLYNDLKTNRTSSVEFNLANMLKFEGQTGPYLQYSIVRINSILRENNYDASNIDTTLFNKTHYYELISTIDEYNSVIAKAIEENSPSYIAKYLYNLASLFNKFYGLEKIVSDDEKVKNTNCLLINSVRTVLKDGLSLLGLNSIERM